MESIKKNNEICLQLNNYEALILFDWLSRFNKAESSLPIQNQAEQRILFDLEAVLEKNLDDVFSSDYKIRLLQARNQIENVEEF